MDFNIWNRYFSIIWRYELKFIVIIFFIRFAPWITSIWIHISQAKDHENQYIFVHPDVPRMHEMHHETFTDMLRSHNKVGSSLMFSFVFKMLFSMQWISQIKRVGQQYVYKPTLHELEEYDAFVGHDGNAKVTVSTLDPEERIEYYDNLKNERNIPSYEGEENIYEERESSQQPEIFRPLHDVFKLKVSFKCIYFVLWTQVCIFTRYFVCFRKCTSIKSKRSRLRRRLMRRKRIRSRTNT